MVLICIFLMISNADHFFICLLMITYHPQKYLLFPLPIFNMVFEFYFVDLCECIYILDIKSLSGVLNVNIFPINLVVLVLAHVFFFP